MTTQKISEMSQQEFDEECRRLRENLKQFRQSLTASN
jgi:ribosomal protein L29